MTDIDPGLLAWVYEATMQDWPGELDFYSQLANELHPSDKILEVGCGTGRVAIHLANLGYTVTGTDISEHMLDRARQKSGNLQITWVQADMYSLHIGETYGLALIPGHSFQFMVSPQAQYACLSGIRSHLRPGGRLVVHMNHDDPSWLARLPLEPGKIFEDAGLAPLPHSKHQLRTWRAWSYEHNTQTATSVNRREEIDMDGKIVNSWLSEPIAMHCVFPTEFEHLALRSGFQIEALYGDFFKAELKEDSDSLIYILRNPAN